MWSLGGKHHYTVPLDYCLRHHSLGELEHKTFSWHGIEWQLGSIVGPKASVEDEELLPFPREQTQHSTRLDFAFVETINSCAQPGSAHTKGCGIKSRVRLK